MAAFDKLFKDNLALGLAVGVGVALLVPVVAPMLATLARPLAKSAIKSGLIVFDKTRETVAELGEVFDDLVAEAKAELTATAAAGAAAATAAATPPHPLSLENHILIPLNNITPKWK